MAVEFGTDGVRGVANRDLTVEVALAIGRAAARILALHHHGSASGRPEVVIGADTRWSGPLLVAAVTAGICAEGADAVDLGVVPTPAVAHTCATRGVPGVMISASHNPFADNGIKLFAAGGLKLDDGAQSTVQAVIHDLLDGDDVAEAPIGAAIGTVRHDELACSVYLDHVVASLDGRTLEGLSVVLDCANGAAATVGPDLLRRLGADVHELASRPDGININEGCGSTHPEALQAAVLERGAAVGIALDGDADRVLAVDDTGRLIDGDRIMALLATDLRDRGRLAADTVVVTVMSNLGFKQAMESAGITVVETRVGDRYVLEAMESGRFSLGGEQSGHLILRDLATTGDGLLGAVQLLDLLQRHRSTACSTLADAAMIRLPQVLRNLRTTRPAGEVAEAMHEAIGEATERLGARGRVLIRPSGTEPLLRVMVEAPTEEEAAEVVERLLAAAGRVDSR